MIADTSSSVPERVVSAGADAGVAIHDEVRLALAGRSSPEGVNRAGHTSVIDEIKATLGALTG